ncbi:hypothetical protein BB558_001310 [Smittium angustum]|uniref:Uncharacterized protein n=1 Tax=Smittium angustum TaxID=133377 RepID=A0A2U1JC59_SMIAN|nr:hypothetical protein BB558_001310 [Smittium angustum]
MHFIRKLVSGNLGWSFNNKDSVCLSYITPKLIATSVPATGIETLWRNNRDSVKRFLENAHDKSYKIYDLCIEREETKYGFEDHTPPNLLLIYEFCRDVSDWFSKNPKNVAVVHCKAGKGRTGTMICSYLLFSHYSESAIEALSLYGEKRTSDGKGVTIPSQKRYVAYFDTVVNQLDCKINFKAFRLTKVHITIEPNKFGIEGMKLVIESYRNEEFKILDNFALLKSENSCIFDKDIQDVELENDVKLEFEGTIPGKKKIKLFKLYLNTLSIEHYDLVDSALDCEKVVTNNQIELVFNRSKLDYYLFSRVPWNNYDWVRAGCGVISKVSEVGCFGGSVQKRGSKVL